MGTVALALIAAVFLIYTGITAAFWILAVDMTSQRTSFHRRRLLEALYALQGSGHLGADAKLVDVLGPLEWDASLSKDTRNRIESELKDLSTETSVLDQLEDADRRERAFAIASWPSIAPGISELQADTARRELESHETNRLENESSIPHAATILEALKEDGFTINASKYAPQRLFEQFLSDSGKEPRRIVDVARRIVPYLRGALTGSIDAIGRGTTIGLVAGFFIGFSRNQGSELILTNVAQWSLQMAAIFALGSRLLFSIRLYKAARREEMKGALAASISFVVMITLFTAEITIAYIFGS